MISRLQPLEPRISDDRIRVLPGIGGDLAPVTLVGMSADARPLLKVEVPLAHMRDALTFVRFYLLRRDREEGR